MMETIGRTSDGIDEDFRGNKAGGAALLFVNRVAKSDRGFTIIEILIVLTIVGILAAIAQPQFKQYVVKARESVLRENLFTLRSVIDQYYADNGKYPDMLQDLVEKKYIRTIPNDPFTNSSDTWVTVPPDSGEEGGIFDVHSGSDLVATDGTSYNEW